MQQNTKPNMKKLILPVLIMSLSFAACKKDDNKCTAKETTVVASSVEIQRIQQYLADSSITAVQHPSGIFYKIEAPGNSSKPNICSYVTVRYVGKFFDGRIFDQTTGNNTASFELKDLIGGWHKGLPLIGVGGKITLFIPPSLAYGPGLYDQGVEVIPPNAFMVFDIELLNIQ